MTGPLSPVVESVAGIVCDVHVIAAISPAFPVVVVSWALSYLLIFQSLYSIFRTWGDLKFQEQASDLYLQLV